MDFESWRCKHEKPGENLFCPEAGCSKAEGCARDNGWKPARERPQLSRMSASDHRYEPGAYGVCRRCGNEHSDHVRAETV